MRASATRSIVRSYSDGARIIATFSDRWLLPTRAALRSSFVASMILVFGPGPTLGEILAFEWSDLAPDFGRAKGFPVLQSQFIFYRTVTQDREKLR
jgi:hypothetical protein